MNIAVCITNYNHQEYLAECLDSVLSQSLLPSEIIIVDDASTDGSRNLINQYASLYLDKIKPIFHEQNQGVTPSRNHALQLVTSDYVTFLDSDDTFMPTKLEMEIKQLTHHPAASFVFSNYRFVDSQGALIHDWLESETEIIDKDLLYHVLVRDFPYWALFRSELVNYRYWQSVGFYDEHMIIWEDDEMRLRLTAHATAKYCNKVLSTYRRHHSGLSSSKTELHAESLKFMYEKNWHLLNKLDSVKRNDATNEIHKFLAHYFRKAATAAIREHQYWTGWKNVWQALQYRHGYGDLYFVASVFKMMLQNSIRAKDKR
jgi:glycosyltransferase involved in cell wall biosynthesis